MSHQDMELDTINHKAIKQVGDRLMPPAAFRSETIRKGATWRFRMIAMAAFLWGCQSEGTLDSRFELARDLAAKIFRWFPAPGKTYEGFKKVLKKHHPKIKAILMELWREARIAPASRSVGDYLVLGVDGSRVELPRTEALEGHYAPARKNNRKSQKQFNNKKNGKKKRNSNKKRTSKKSAGRKTASAYKKKTSPQMWLTLLWDAATGLPWNWRTGPSDSSEREHLREMLPKLPRNTLITADAGFVGYDFWKSILDEGLSFVIRVGSNVKLIRGLGYARQYEHTVYLWPERAMKKKQPPLALRLIVLHDGKEPVYLVTNLTKSQLSDRQAGQVYELRWGIEVFFRTFKQTFKRRKLCSRTPDYAELELDWALLSLWGMLLAGQQMQEEDGVDEVRQSPAKTIRIFQATITDYRIRPATEEYSLWLGLRTAVLDGYERTGTKTSRNHPRKKQKDRTGPPHMATATTQQQLAAKQFTNNQPQFRLAA